MQFRSPDLKEYAIGIGGKVLHTARPITRTMRQRAVAGKNGMINPPSKHGKFFMIFMAAVISTAVNAIMFAIAKSLRKK